MRLVIPHALLSEMLSHLRSSLPEEACGLLGGTGGRVSRVYPVENELHSPFAYRMEPYAQIEAMMDIERRGWEVQAIFHSHPGGPPAPSVSDVHQAYYPESLYLIVAPDGTGGMALRAFEIVDGVVRDAVVEFDDGVTGHGRTRKDTEAP